MDYRSVLKCAVEKVKKLNAEELLREGLLARNGYYLPMLFYPPPCWSFQEMGEEKFFQNFSTCTQESFGIYVHIPFCMQRCSYCSFPIVEEISNPDKDRYLSALEKEMDLYKDRLGTKTISARSVNVGGGTPTLMSPRQLARFSSFLHKKIDLSLSQEMTIDVDPATLLGDEGIQRLRILKDYGFNRMTIGAQSFDDNILESMKRPHDAKDIIKAIHQARRAGFDNICLDIIYGFPGESIESWIKTMENVISAGVESYQIYRLRVFPISPLRKSVIHEMFLDHPESFPSFEELLLMKAVVGILSRQYGYEEDGDYTGVFSKTRKGQSVFNTEQCGKTLDVLGFGMAAFNSLGNTFGIKTYRDMYAYCQAVENNIIPFVEGIRRSEQDERSRRFLGILKYKGKVGKEFLGTGAQESETFRKRIEKLKSFGLMEENRSRIALTPRGKFFVDDVCLQFYRKIYLPFPREAFNEGALNPYNEFS